MQIKINNENLIIAYAEVGSLDGGIEIDDSIVPFGFMDMFKPLIFKYTDNKIIYNENFNIQKEINNKPPE